MNEEVSYRATTANLTIQNGAAKYPFDDGVGSVSIHKHADGLITLNITRDPVSVHVYVDSYIIEILKHLITWYERVEENI